MSKKSSWSSVFRNMTVWAVALGYFVDIFDLTLFSMVRKASLTELGVPEAELLTQGQLLLNVQMCGMLFGGIFFGLLGDKKGRMGSLFASITLYSLANFANAFVHDVETYALLRFIAGVGLAGELGLGVTLVAEILPQQFRGMGTALVATIGVLGAVFGGLLVEFVSWQHCYLIGGLLGLTLLVLRMSVQESDLFTNLKHKPIQRGNIFSLFTDRHKFFRFLWCVLLGSPIWFVAGILMTLAPELGVQLGVNGIILSSRAIAISYLGLALGDFLSGWCCQILQSRKKVVYILLSLTVFFVTLLLTTTKNKSTEYYYFLCFLVGVGAGFWAVFVTIAAEQFGTNLRATVATTVPNFVRASVIPMNIFLTFLMKDHGYTLIQGTIVLGVFVFGLAFVAAFSMHETFHKDLNYNE